MHTMKLWHMIAFFVFAVGGTSLLRHFGVGFQGITCFIICCCLAAIFGPGLWRAFWDRYDYIGPRGISFGHLFYAATGLDFFLGVGEGEEGHVDERALVRTQGNGLAASEVDVTLVVGPEAELAADDTFQSGIVLERPQPLGTSALISLVLPEEWASLGLPMLVVDPYGQGFSLLNEFPNGFVVGSPQGIELLPMATRARYLPISDAQQGADLGHALLQGRMQVIFAFGSYADSLAKQTAPIQSLSRVDCSQGAHVLLGILSGMVNWQMSRASGNRLPSIILLTAAQPFLAQDTAMAATLVKDSGVAQELKGTLLHILLDGSMHGLNLYLTAPTLVGLDPHALQLCKLWFIHQSLALSAGDVEGICRYCPGITRDHLQAREEHGTLLVDNTATDFHYINFRESRSPYSGQQVVPTVAALKQPHFQQPLLVAGPAQPPQQETRSPRRTYDLSSDTTRPRPSARMYDFDGSQQGYGHQPSALPQRKPFTVEQVGYGAILFADNALTVHALREPPAAYRQLVQALNGGLPLPSGYLMSHERASSLYSILLELDPQRRKKYEWHARRLLDDMPPPMPSIDWQDRFGAAAFAMGRHAQEERQDGGLPAATWRPALAPAAEATAWRRPARLLSQQSGPVQPLGQEEILGLARILKQTLDAHRAYAEVRPQDTRVGPTVIRLAVRPTGEAMTDYAMNGQAVMPLQGENDHVQYKKPTKVREIIACQADIALALGARRLRIEAPTPGEHFVGIEIPNPRPMIVPLGELLASSVYQERLARSPSRLVFPLGKDVAGKIIVVDLEGCPHLLVAGATGGGKSVLLNDIIVSILHQTTPEGVRMLLIDPKRVELSIYEGCPHLLSPVVVDPTQAVAALQKLIALMEQRYQRFAKLQVRNLAGYRKLRSERSALGDHSLASMPSIVVVIDELGDLMLVAKEQIEDLLVRLAQLSRATGIHLVLATQRPTVDVITGNIKANVPARIAFMVSSGTDSRTIIDMNGAEDLLGQGDLLYLPADQGQPTRAQCGLVTDDECLATADFWREQAEDQKRTRHLSDERAQGGRTTTSTVHLPDDDEVSDHPQVVNASAPYVSSAVPRPADEEWTNAPQAEHTPVSHSAAATRETETSDDEDIDYEQAKAKVIEMGCASISKLQRWMRWGYQKSARMIDLLEERGVVGKDPGRGQLRDVLAQKPETEPATTAERG